MVGDALISGRDALHRLDALTSAARSDFEAAVQAADSQRDRYAQLSQLRSQSYRELAGMRLAGIEDGSLRSMSAVEERAIAMLADHNGFVDELALDASTLETELRAIEGRRRTAEAKADTALQSYETQVSATHDRLSADNGYLALLVAYEEAQAVTERSTRKLELARTDRADKGRPYESDPLFAYLWKRGFRTPAYEGKGLEKMLDNRVAQLCGYDAAWLNYQRLTELPERLAEHVGRMRLEEAEAERAIEGYEAAALKTDGADALADALTAARRSVEKIDAELAIAEARHAELREKQHAASSGDSGPIAEARALIEAELARASFPDLRVLAAETTTLDDDRIVDALVRLRTEELQLEGNRDRVEALPGLRRGVLDALETSRRRFKEAGFDNPYVGVSSGAFEAALEGARSLQPDGERLWRALAASVRRAPRRDDRYFGGRRRRDAIGLPDMSGSDRMGDVAGVVIGEVFRQMGRSGGRSGGLGTGGPWGASGEKPGSTRPMSSRGGGRKGGGGFKTGGRF